jgi:uncharacterized protein (TIGR02996 family)
VSHEQAFFEDIVAHSPDDAPRLVYADWLDDHGQSDRAEFIRVQCELARLAEDDPRHARLALREHELRQAHGKAWAEPLRGAADEWVYERGFVERASIDTCWDGGLPQRLDQLFARAPVRALHLELDSLAGLLQASRHLRRVNWLSLFFDSDVEVAELGALLSSPDLVNLKTLLLDTEYADETPPAALCKLADNPALAGLTELGFAIGESPGDLHPRVIRAVARSPHLGNLRRLHLLFAALDLDLTRQLAGSANLAGLTYLNFTGSSGSEPAWRELLRAPWLGRLESLYLDDVAVSRGRAQRDLAEHPLAAELRARCRHSALRFAYPPRDELLPAIHGQRW